MELLVSIVVAITIVAILVVYSRTGIVGFLFVGMAGLLELRSLIPERLRLYVDVVAIACAGWGYARILTVDYARLVGARSRASTTGEISNEDATAQRVPIRRTVIFCLFHLVVGFVSAYLRPEHKFVTFTFLLFGAEIAVVDLIYVRLRLGLGSA